jgi:hypothetical protein
MFKQALNAPKLIVIWPFSIDWIRKSVWRRNKKIKSRHEKIKVFHVVFFMNDFYIFMLHISHESHYKYFFPQNNTRFFDFSPVVNALFLVTPFSKHTKGVKTTLFFHFLTVEEKSWGLKVKWKWLFNSRVGKK